MTSFIKRLFRSKPGNRTDATTPGLDRPDQVAEIGNESIPPTTQIESNPLLQTLLQKPQLVVGTAHSVGVQRDHNEDALSALTTYLVSGEITMNFGLYIVADGMGGHDNGELASKIAIEKFSSHVIDSIYLPLLSAERSSMDRSIQEIMQSGILHAHQAIKLATLGGGTTLTAALILGDQLTIAHIGDSRAYLADANRNFQLLTHDHSLVKRLEEIGQITADQALVHPQKNVLYRAVGRGEPSSADIATYHFQPGDQLLLCTDGLWGVLTVADLESAIWSSTDPQQTCQSLVYLANSAGGPDNISVILIRMVE